MRYVKYFRFCGWRHFSYHEANGPESSTTLYFEEVRQVAVPVGRQTTTVFGGVHENAAKGRSLLSTISLLFLTLDPTKSDSRK